MVPPAPGRFSTTIGCLTCFETCSSTMRPTMSLAAPAANGTTAWIVRSGHCASAACGVVKSKAPARCHMRAEVIRLLLLMLRMARIGVRPHRGQRRRTDAGPARPSAGGGLLLPANIGEGACNRLLAAARERSRMLPLQECDQLLAHLAAQIPQRRRRARADQHANLDGRILGVGDLDVHDFAIPQLRLRGDLARLLADAI